MPSPEIGRQNIPHIKAVVKPSRSQTDSIAIRLMEPFTGIVSHDLIETAPVPFAYRNLNLFVQIKNDHSLRLVLLPLVGPIGTGSLLMGDKVTGVLIFLSRSDLHETVLSKFYSMFHDCSSDDSVGLLERICPTVFRQSAHIAIVGTCANDTKSCKQ
jgi:hypothetical protein